MATVIPRVVGVNGKDPIYHIYHMLHLHSIRAVCCR